MSEHFEGLGDIWEAFNYFGDAEKFVEIIRASVEDGKIKHDLHEAAYIVYPENNSIQLCSLIEKKNNTNEFISMFPLLAGIPAKLNITEKYTWENGLEGEVSGKWLGGREINFFAPFYYQQFLNTEINKEFTVYLSGIAFSVKDDTGNKFEIDKGDMYEMQLRKFLKDNPDKTKKDFPCITVHMGDVSVLFPTQYYSNFEYRGPILSIEYTELLGAKIAKAKIRILRSGYDVKAEEELCINLYLTEHALNGYNPKEGDCITGAMWLTGYLEG
ncbi:MAG: hypothetical protein LBQ47_07520, partial [Endomicrobium sp.]|nr:hypothetical protein [Endomicrobium sp.]